jgi:hypothetical protein
MDDIEEGALYRAAHKPHCWIRYPDDTLVIWPIYQNCSTSWAVSTGTATFSSASRLSEEDGHLPFLDIATTDCHVTRHVYPDDRSRGTLR